MPRLYTRPVRYSLSVPNFGPFADPRTTAELAREAEDAGWDGFFLWDHLLAPDGSAVGDPWTMLAAAAVATRRIRLGTMVTPLARRRPWQVARQVVTLDHLSEGRAVLGVGLGFPPDREFARFGEPSGGRERAELLDEGLEVLAALMTGEPVTHAGAHFSLHDVTFVQRPVQRPRVPIWVAGMWPNRRPFRRAARFDGIVPIGADEHGDEILITVEMMREAVAYTREHRTAAGPFEHVFTGWLPEDGAEAASVADELKSFGVTWWKVGPAPGEDVQSFRGWMRPGPPS
jgi:alkanesulfonate monooxygenase SsuD/methylene tetrahydromethanopterin reductase-like flavin-dependent oxidoreductase (luciferase family)